MASNKAKKSTVQNPGNIVQQGFDWQQWQQNIPRPLISQLGEMRKQITGMASDCQTLLVLFDGYFHAFTGGVTGVTTQQRSSAQSRRKPARSTQAKAKSLAAPAV